MSGGAGSAGGTTTVSLATEAFAPFIGGFVAAEGYFMHITAPPRFRFAIGLGATDAELCEVLRTFFGVGAVYHSPRREAHYDDEVAFVVQGMPQLVDVIVPFMDEHLPESYKRRQYLEWRASLLEYWDHRAKRRRPCTVDDCERPRRAHGLCRRHLWALRRE